MHHRIRPVWRRAETIPRGRSLSVGARPPARHLGSGLRDETLEMMTAPARLGLTATPPRTSPSWLGSVSWWVLRSSSGPSRRPAAQREDAPLRPPFSPRAGLSLAAGPPRRARALRPPASARLAARLREPLPCECPPMKLRLALHVLGRLQRSRPSRPPVPRVRGLDKGAIRFDRGDHLTLVGVVEASPGRSSGEGRRRRDRSVVWSRPGRRFGTGPPGGSAVRPAQLVAPCQPLGRCQ